MIRQRLLVPMLCRRAPPRIVFRYCAGPSQTMKDKDFLAEAVKSKLDVDPVSGEEVGKIVSGLFKLDSATVARMSEVLK